MATISVDVVASCDPSTAATETMPVMVELTLPERPTGDRPPCDVCCVVDVSASMGNEALLKGETGEMSGHGLSVLDIVKHALRTILGTMGATDRVALVSYSQNAGVVFPLTIPSSEAERTRLGRAIDEMRPSGMTNLWDGLKSGVELLKEGQQPGRLQHIMLFTDGLPNINPPRGILPMLTRLKAKEPGGRLPCTVNTYGFGNELDSELLSELGVRSSGSYAFIPDAGFVGTVFVNAISNLLSVCAANVEVKLEPMNGASFAGDEPFTGGYQVLNRDAGSATINLGTTRFGQPSSLVVQMNIPRTAVGPGYLRAQATVAFGPTEADRVALREAVGQGVPAPGRMLVAEVERLRLNLVDCLRRSMQAVKLSSVDKMQGKPVPVELAQAIITAVLDEFGRSPAKDVEQVKFMMEDLSGQVMEAFTMEEWYTKWGVHFIPSLMFAHSTKQCNNFKDPGVQEYGGPLFTEIRDRSEQIFQQIPPPVPTAPPPAPTPSAVVRAPVASAHAPVDMRGFYNAGGGCFDGACKVRMADGSERRASEVLKGDVLAAPPDSNQKASQVLCSVRTLVPGGKLSLVSFEGGLRITAHHPVFVGGEWRFPADVGEDEDVEVDCGAVYSFLLEEGGSAVVVDGIPCASLGHGLQEGAAKHPFYSSFNRVTEDLQRFPGFTAGLVELSPDSLRRDPLTGLVAGFA